VKHVCRLLYFKSANGLWMPLFAAAILVATAVMALADWPPTTPQQSSTPHQVQAAPAETSAYTRWLNGEVAYIITDEERAAFQSLSTDEEREAFVEQFWERRNPNPGSAENEFKEEFYRRITYANNHFAAGRPGWKTDRGHLYIIYGPPDEIDSRLGSKTYFAGHAPVTEALEVWTYNYIDGLGNNIAFTFADQTGKGDFNLASPPWKQPATPAPPRGL
jgi:GWxTD domain-containing protein